jgi:hypothetical protein
VISATEENCSKEISRPGKDLADVVAFQLPPIRKHEFQLERFLDNITVVSPNYGEDFWAAVLIVLGIFEMMGVEKTDYIAFGAAQRKFFINRPLEVFFCSEIAFSAAAEYRQDTSHSYQYFKRVLQSTFSRA